jgi:hypothetical protein
MPWHAVDRVFFEGMNKITYDENFLILEGTDGKTIEVGELDDGFSDFEQDLVRKLPAFPEDWRQMTAAITPGVRELVWKRGSAKNDANRSPKRVR